MNFSSWSGHTGRQANWKGSGWVAYFGWMTSLVQDTNCIIRDLRVVCRFFGYIHSAMSWILFHCGHISRHTFTTINGGHVIFYILMLNMHDFEFQN